jgi:alpha-1,2-mannosyltransferase
MGRLRQALRNGDWLTNERIRLVAFALLIASVAGLLFLVVTANGVIDRQGRPLGTDFSNIYAAGTYVLDGRPEAPFDPPQQYARERALFGPATQFYGWHYPPFFLFIAAALALLPYGLALAVWQASTLGLYLLAIWAILFLSPGVRVEGIGGLRPSSFKQERDAKHRYGEGESPPGPELRQGPLTRIAAQFDLSPRAGRGHYLWLLLALAFPAVLINVGHGQNGFLTTALLGGGLVLLDRRPLLAGILIGLLAYKPQYGLLIPLVLAVSGRWRSFAAAAVTVAALTLATVLCFGPQVWNAFLASTEFTRTVVLEQGNTGWHKIQSVFSWARMWGASIAVAYALQGALIVALGAALVWLWRSSASYPLKAAALCLATILATPYSLDYDMMLLAPAIAFIATDGISRGFGPWQKTALAALWLVPLVARSVAQATMIPLGVPAMLAMFALVLWRAELAVPMAFANARSTMASSPGDHHAATTSPR